MTQVIEITIELAQFQFPPAVHDSAKPTLHERLQFLLDSAEPTLRERQDTGTQLSENERLEVEGLVEVAEFLSLIRLRSHQVTK
jgi:hypothetical protein